MSWAGLCPCARQSGPAPGPARRAGAAAACAAASARPPSAPPAPPPFPGEHYHRIARRRGKTKAQVAVARSILLIIWHLLSDQSPGTPTLTPGYYQTRTGTDRNLRDHVRQIQALGFEVTVTKTP